jgi:lipoprotein signal peptidase
MLAVAPAIVAVDPVFKVCAVLLVLGCELHFSTLSSFIGCHLGLNSGYSFGNFDGAIGKQVCQCTRLHT